MLIIANAITTVFAFIRPTEIFIWKNLTMMRIEDPNCASNAICLSTGKMHTFKKETQVTPKPNACLLLDGKRNGE